jgi:predicted amidohydrolase YtcJ
MRKPACAVLLILTLWFAQTAGVVRGQAVAPKPADLVLRNGAVYTLNAARNWAEAVAVAGGRIVYVGPESGAARWVGPATKVVDLQGRMVLPGFHDSHVHPIQGEVPLGKCDLTKATTREQALETIRLHALAYPNRQWIAGAGWLLPMFADVGPDKVLLDKIGNYSRHFLIQSVASQVD